MIDSIYKQISDIIIWYKDIGILTQNINQLLEYKDMLAISSYMLAEFAATKKIDYNVAYFVRKVSVIREKEQNNKNMSATKAETKAMLSKENDYYREINAQGEAYKADLLLKQVNKILDCMTQRISYLKQELEYTKQQKIT
jgi:hypothetical protein